MALDSLAIVFRANPKIAARAKAARQALLKPLCRDESLLGAQNLEEEGLESEGLIKAIIELV